MKIQQTVKKETDDEERIPHHYEAVRDVASSPAIKQRCNGIGKKIKGLAKQGKTFYEYGGNLTRETADGIAAVFRDKQYNVDVMPTDGDWSDKSEKKRKVWYVRIAWDTTNRNY